MSSTMKLSLLALVSTVAAVPHYGAHSKFHSLKPSGTEGYGHGHQGTGRPYPTAGWQGYNATTVAPLPTETGDYNDEQPKTIDVTSTSTLTITSTIHVKPSSAAANNNYEASSVAVADYVASSPAASSPAGVCAPPKTVTVTAAEKVTITVGEGNDKPYTPAPQPSAPPAEPKPSAPPAEPKPSAPPAESYVLASSAAPVEKPSTPAAQYPAETPKAETPSSKKVEEYVAPTSSAAPVYSSAAPSAAPSATPPATGNSYSGVKRGLVYNDASLCKTLGGKFGFGHNWAQVENNDIGAMFIPTMHGPTKGTPEGWLANVDKAVKKGSTAIQGFNECDHAEQCALSPEAACAAWKQFMNPAKAKYPQLTVIGPSVTNGPAPMGLDWLSRFHSACPDAAVDATNIHFYDIYQEANPSIGQSSTLDRFKVHVKKAADTYGQKVWITEFGLNPGSATPEQAGKFLKDAMAYLDGADYVQGYSWYKVGDGVTELNSALAQTYAAAS